MIVIMVMRWPDVFVCVQGDEHFDDVMKGRAAAETARTTAANTTVTGKITVTSNNAC